MVSKISYCSEIIMNIMSFMAAITFFFVVQMIVLGGLGPLFIQGLFVLSFAAVIVIRLLINGNFIIYMAAHLTLFLTLAAIPVRSIIFIVFAIYLIVLTIRSVSYWKNNGMKKEVEIPWLTVGLFVISYIYAYVTHHNLLTDYLLVVGSLYLLLYMVRLYLKGIADIAGNRLFYKQLPLSQIVKTNSFMVGGVVVITALAMFLAVLIDADDLIYVIGDGLIVIIRVFLKGFFVVLTWIADLFKNVDYTGIEQLWEELGNVVTKEGLVSKIIRLILAALKILITVLFLLWVGKGMNNKIRNYLKDNILPTDRVEKIRIKDKSLISAVSSITRRKSDEPANPIRRKYKREIKHFGSRLVLTKAMTVGQIEAQMTEKEAAGMKALKEAYEKERYRDEI